MTACALQPAVGLCLRAANEGEKRSRGAGVAGRVHCGRFRDRSQANHSRTNGISASRPVPCRIAIASSSVISSSLDRMNQGDLLCKCRFQKHRGLP
jgi:hypothetical protein